MIIRIRGCWVATACADIVVGIQIFIWTRQCLICSTLGWQVVCFLCFLLKLNAPGLNVLILISIRLLSRAIYKATFFSAASGLTSHNSSTLDLVADFFLGLDSQKILLKRIFRSWRRDDLIHQLCLLCALTWLPACWRESILAKFHQRLQGSLWQDSWSVKIGLPMVAISCKRRWIYIWEFLIASLPNYKPLWVDWWSNSNVLQTNCCRSLLSSSKKGIFIKASGLQTWPKLVANSNFLTFLVVFTCLSLVKRGRRSCQLTIIPLLKGV